MSEIISPPIKPPTEKIDGFTPSEIACMDTDGMITFWDEVDKLLIEGKTITLKVILCD